MKVAPLAIAVAISSAFPLIAIADVRHDEGIGFYVGLDARATVPSGSYVGLPEANAARLTLLFDHGDHFHGIGTYSYAGPAPHPALLDTNSNNRIPEGFSGESPLSLTLGSGTYAGKLRSSVGGSEYSFLGIASIQSLAGFASGSAEDVLFQSGANRWSSTLSGVSVGLQLVSATPGLHIGTETVDNLFANSDTILLGHGNAFEFKPVYWVDGAAAAGTYSAEFRLVNLNPTSPYGDSGRFYFDFAVATAPVPEPEHYALLIAGLPLVAWMARRRRKQTIES